MTPSKQAPHRGAKGITMNNLKQNILALLVFTMLCIDPDSIINLVVSLL